MKWLALCLIVSLSTSTLPAAAQKSSNLKKINRVNGASCETELVSSAKKVSKVPCHHLLITESDAGKPFLNFRFDDQKEGSGLSYIVQPFQEGEKTTYIIGAVFVHKSGKAQPNDIQKASGACSLDSGKFAAGCIGSGADGTGYRSVITKK
jgi:hypothetical protein